MSSSVVAAGDGAEALLACCVPLHREPKNSCSVLPLESQYGPVVPKTAALLSVKSAGELTICSLMTLPSSSTVLIFCKCKRLSDQQGHPLNRTAVICCRGRDTYKVHTDRGDVTLCVGVILQADRRSVRRACQRRKLKELGRRESRTYRETEQEA